MTKIVPKRIRRSHCVSCCTTGERRKPSKDASKSFLLKAAIACWLANTTNPGSVVVWAKSNNNNNNNSGNNNDGGKYYSSARQQQRAAATNNNNDNYYNAGVDETATQAPVNLVTTQDFCKRHFVQVTQLSILCDTPGAYYSGSTAYRDSPICVGGDKAKLNVTFRIPRGLMTSSSSEGSILYVQVELGLYDRFQTVATATALCQLNVMQVSSYSDVAGGNDDPYECPHAGVYQWTVYYTVPSSLTVDYSLRYTPDVRITFFNANNDRVGCVVTGPIALATKAKTKAMEGGLALGISVVIFIGIFSILLYLSDRRKRRLSQQQRSHPTTTSTAMQYQYFRTLPNGQVIPVTGHPPRPTILFRPQQHSSTTTLPAQKLAKHDDDDDDDDDDDSDDALNISNPAYNETHLPSRPII